MKLSRWLALALVLVTLLPGMAWGGGFHVNLLGTRRTSMLTNVGNPDDVTALYHNPAGLASQSGLRLHVSSGMAFLDSQMTMKALDPARFPSINPSGCGEPGQAACPWPVDADGYYKQEISPDRYTSVIPYLGISEDLEKLAGGPKDVVVSFAAYAPGAYGGFLPDDAPSAYFITDALFLVAAATGGVGFKLNDMVSLGANLSYNYMRLKYARKFSTVDVMSPRPGAVTGTASLAQDVLGDLMFDFNGSDNGFGWGLGALVTPNEHVSVGLSYTGFTGARFKGDVELSSLGTSRSKELSSSELTKVAGSLGYKLPTGLEVEMPVPPTFLAGLSVRPNSRVEIGLDLRLYVYSIYKKQVLRPIYDSAASGTEPMSEESLSSTKDYSNSWAAALGLLVRPFTSESIELMTGISFDKSPVPDKNFTIDNPSMDQACWAAGVRAYVTDSIRLGASYMFIKYLQRDITTSETWPPTNVRISNYSHIPNVEMEWIF